MLSAAGLFLIQTLFDLFIYVLILRFLLEMIHADYYNPLSQFSLKLTQWMVQPIRRIVPRSRHVDYATLILLFALEIIKLYLVLSLKFGALPNFIGIFIMTIAELLEKFITFYFYAIIMRVILSWITPAHHNPIFFIITQLTEPLLLPCRRLIPLIGGFDLSPLFALIILQLVNMIVVNSLTSLAIQLL